ncbi:unnamed protein product [Cylindrotheca closterium]|uniref:Pyridoxal 5'-phosphate synthase n=1 Tax=Cylindrotheca closterium TaxID=2856 RepID=A0AAD2FS10_9STRA|nr:unnamed protein product [Cylindrotheca closterium]
MGLKGKMRWLHSFFLVAFAVVGCTHAQGVSDTVSPSPTLSKYPSGNPSISWAPSILPSFSQLPSLSQSPSASSIPSLRPPNGSSVSTQPSGLPSRMPTASASPSLRPSLINVASEAPSLSETPSVAPSLLPSFSDAPTASQAPSDSIYPSVLPSGPLTPVADNSPTKSLQPTVVPSSSLDPTSSIQPTREPLKPIVEWKMLVANRFQYAFSDVEAGATASNKDSDRDTIVITATNTTSVRLGELPSTPVLAMTGQVTIELNEWVDVTNYRIVQMLFWFYARRNQANVESDRFVVEYANRTAANGDGTWITLKTYQRGRGRFRRNNRWYLGRVIISTPDLEAVQFRLQSFFPTSTKMVLLDKFGILGFGKEGMGTTSDKNSLSQESQQRGVSNEEPIRGRSTNFYDDSWLSHHRESLQRGGPNRIESVQPIRGKLTNLTVDETWLSQPLA